jgi:hypothetical protein
MAEEKEQSQAEEAAPEVTVRDRRRVTPEGEIRDLSEVRPEVPPEAGPGAEESGQVGAEQPAPEAEKPEPRLPTLYDFFRLMLMELRAQAWPYLARSAEGGALSAEDQAQIRFGRELHTLLLNRLEAAPDLSAEEKEELQRLRSAEGGGYPDVARLMLMELHARAWQSLGLMPHPLTNLITTDLAQARQAIDTYGEILNQVEAHGVLPPAELREYRRLKNDLQMNYVQRAGLR